MTTQTVRVTAHAPASWPRTFVKSSASAAQTVRAPCFHHRLPKWLALECPDSFLLPLSCLETFNIPLLCCRHPTGRKGVISHVVGVALFYFLIFNFKTSLFYVYECFPCFYVCAPHTRRWWAFVWVLGIEPQSFVTATSALIHWANLSALRNTILRCPLSGIFCIYIWM